MSLIEISKRDGVKEKSKEKLSKNIKYRYPNLKIAVLIPAYNEEKNISSVLNKIPHSLSQKTYIIVVDDGSKDNTAKIAKKFGAIVLKHNKNKGNGAATITGLEYCKKQKYDIVIIMDADGQHKPLFLPKLIRMVIKEGFDFAIANRFKYPYDMNAYKKLCSKMMTAFYFFLFRKKISDPTNGYRALSSKVLNNLDLESQYSITQEMLFKVLPKFKWTEIPVKIEERKNGESFIKLGNYFFKMILIFLKYYLFPKIRNLTKKIFSASLRRRIGYYLLKT